MFWSIFNIRNVRKTLTLLLDVEIVPDMVVWNVALNASGRGRVVSVLMGSCTMEVYVTTFLDVFMLH